MKSITYFTFALCIIFTMFSCTSNEENEEMEEMEAPYVPIQTRINNGETPQELYIDISISVDSLVGKEYLGGIIAFINRRDNGDLITSEFEEFGIIAAKELLGPAQWGCKGEKMDDIYDTLFNGSINTENIAMKCDEPNTAAKLVLGYEIDGFKDWHLPSFTASQTISEGLGKLFNYSMENVWSSSEKNGECVWALRYIGNGNMDCQPKDEELYVLPIKHF
ncbi:MAG: hypothetical protein P1U56_20210 [Saprospiraceae bacterium]|nr:hypothetical protein [Saprospiraceae bacterium]